MKNTKYLRGKVAIIQCSILGLVILTMPFWGFAQSVPASQDIEPPQQQSTTIDPSYTIEQLSGDGVVGDFVVGPGKVELVISPGESKTVELLVTNRMGEPKTFKLEIEDAQGSRVADTPVVLLGNDRGPYTLKDYISIPNMEFDLEHMERARIPVTITLPADAEPGGRYGSVLVSTVSRDANLDPANGAQPSSAIISRVGTLFFITTPGSTDINGELVAFSTIPDRSIFLSGPIDFGVVYENTGSVHLSPYGEVRITNMLGEEVGFVELDPWFILPKSLRTREISWNREFLIGRYTATAFINRGYDDVIDEQSVTFWVFPWKWISVIFIGLFIVFLLVRLLVTRFELKRK